MPRRWAMLLLLSAAELLGMCVWFSASAVSSQLAERFGLDRGETGWLTTAVQLGFVAGTALAAALNLADLLPARAYVAGSAFAAAAANAGVVFATGYPTALALRFLTGLCLAGVYPPAMKMIATWFRTSRGLAIGTLVGALTTGKAFPYLFKALGGGDWRVVVLTASAGTALAAGLVAAGYRDGPFPFERRPFSFGLAGVVLRDRSTRLAIAGYLGHMWELYAMWTWIPGFIAAALAVRGAPASWVSDVLAFGAIAAGGAGCLWGGWQADRSGREKLVNLAMATSGTCSVVIGLFFGASPWLLVPIAWIWGFFVVADSAQFSTLVTEVAPRHAVGTALTLQTSLGFLLTMATIQLVPRLVEIVGWRWAFSALALGPLAGIVAIHRLAAARFSAARRGAGATAGP